ncbi:TauD/TfdA family dioxygenase [Pseudonocardia acaciae]|uniref:TauD/TfdA family dioxygenase n=1 Tax=Pseudonocardia acaciae TaxID=551276 RepID=UPI000AEFFBF3|nr:TauD/TfdA family dioxygenase [Pseudonocardia acaciae]
MDPVTVRLSEASTHTLRTLSDRLAPALADDPRATTVSLPELPPGLRDELRACARTGHDGVTVLRRLPVDADRMGPTPARWSEVSDQAGAQWAAQMLLLARALGRPIGWAGQQDGRLVHDILPTRGEEREQTGASSAVELSPHTEDAFHPGRANLLLLACVRNPDRVPTTAASVRHARLADTERELLADPALPILPDSSYAEADGFGGQAPPVATVWETGAGLGLRYDPAYTPLDDGNPAYLRAYRRLGAELARAAVGVRLDPGDVLVIDNDVAVHGRQPFRARYDGTDRWLRRVSVRVPGRRRPDADEHGYGQRVLDPFAGRFEDEEDTP